MTTDRKPDALQFVGSHTIYSAARTARDHRLQHAPDAETAHAIWYGGGVFWVPFADDIHGVIVPDRFGDGGPSIALASDMADQRSAMRVAPLPDEFA